MATLSDIRRLLSELDPASAGSSGQVQIQSEVQSEDEHGRSVTYRVWAPTAPQSKRAILLQGMEMVKSRAGLRELMSRPAEEVAVNGRVMRPPASASPDAMSWIDPLIRRWLNATRDGAMICWDVREGRFAYDIFSHKLFTAKRREGADAT